MSGKKKENSFSNPDNAELHADAPSTPQNDSDSSVIVQPNIHNDIENQRQNKRDSKNQTLVMVPKKKTIIYTGYN